MKFWHSRHGSQIKLTTAELLEISQEISREFAPDCSDSTPEIVILTVDPYHLYAYWNIGETKVNGATKADAGNNLTLRIFWRPDENIDVAKTRLCFDVTVNQNLKRLKVRLPIDKTAYSAAIGKHSQKDHRFTVYAYSNTIYVPRGGIGRQSAVDDASIVESEPLPARTKAQHGKTAANKDKLALFEGYVGKSKINPKMKERVYENFFFEALKKSHILETLPEQCLDSRFNPVKTASEKSHYAGNNPSGRKNNT